MIPVAALRLGFMFLTVVAFNIGATASTTTCTAFHHYAATAVTRTAIPSRLPTFGTIAFTRANPLAKTAIRSSLGSAINSNADEDEDKWRQELPFPLNTYRKQSLKRIQCYMGDTPLDIYVIGTVHVIDNSPRDVRLLLETIRPDLIFVELCYPRFATFVWEEEEEARTTTSNNETDTKQSQQPIEYYTKDPSFEEIKQQMLAEWFGTKHGGDMLEAYKHWKERVSKQQKEEECSDDLPMLVVGDRPYEVTEARQAEATTKWDKTKRVLKGTVGNKRLLGSILGLGTAWRLGLGGTAVSIGIGYSLFSFDSKKKRYRQMFRSLLYETTSDDTRSSTSDDDYQRYKDTTMPKVVARDEDVRVKERDVYMACKLFQACQFFPPVPVVQADDENDSDSNDEEKERYSAVVVVGQAHVEGMCAFFSQLLVTTETPEDYLPPLLQSNTFQLEENVFNDLVHCVPMLKPKDIEWLSKK